ncbi:hypothetical protein [Halovenus sp. HT40]|uniref:hypothetical protein n=1 Tax=Halovenus sp. HT40 TaxID=3126691 RepID=UPI00300F20C3
MSKPDNLGTIPPRSGVEVRGHVVVLVVPNLSALRREKELEWTCQQITRQAPAEATTEAATECIHGLLAVTPWVTDSLPSPTMLEKHCQEIASEFDISDIGIVASASFSADNIETYDSITDGLAALRRDPQPDPA